MGHDTAPQRMPRCGQDPSEQRSFCCWTPHRVEATLTLAAHDGGTACELRVFGRCPYRTVEIRELPDNRGAPAGSRLDSIVSWLRDGMLLCRHEPTWLEHSPARPLLDVARGDGTAVRHRLVRLHDSWLRLPLSPAQYRELVRRGRAGGSAQPPGPGPQPW